MPAYKLEAAGKAVKNLEWFLGLIVSMSHVTKVALQSVQTVDYNNNLSLSIEVTVAFQVLVINLGNREQLRLISSIFILNALKILF